MIRVAAVGDVHFGTDSRGSLRPHLARLSDEADLLLLAGDLTRRGTVEEARTLVDDLAEVTVPMVAVLGNHDLHSDAGADIVRVLTDAGMHVLEGDSTVMSVDGRTVGVAGVKGFGGGFAGANGTDFGEPEMKAFIGHTKAKADALGTALAEMATDVRIALLHYAPVKDTLQGERLELYPFLGSYLFGQAIDDAGADLAVHGHAHGGTEKGVTPGGTHVRNVALPVIGHSYRVYCLNGVGDAECRTDETAASRSAATR